MNGLSVIATGIAESVPFSGQQIVLHKLSAQWTDGSTCQRAGNPMVYSYTEKKRIRKDFGKVHKFWMYLISFLSSLTRFRNYRARS